MRSYSRFSGSNDKATFLNPGFPKACGNFISLNAPTNELKLVEITPREKLIATSCLAHGVMLCNQARTEYSEVCGLPWAATEHFNSIFNNLANKDRGKCWQPSTQAHILLSVFCNCLVFSCIYLASYCEHIEGDGTSSWFHCLVVLESWVTLNHVCSPHEVSACCSW